MNTNFEYFRNTMGWPPDKRAKNGYYSTIYLYGSGLSTDNADTTALGGWQGSVNYNGEEWPMVFLSYYPVACFDPKFKYTDADYQTGACVHEGIHAVLADLPGCKNSAWFQEGGNTWLQLQATAQQSGDYSSVGYLNGGPCLAPFMPIECYSGWLQDDSFGGPSAEGVNMTNSNGDQVCTWRTYLGGMQYANNWPVFLGETMGIGSVPWIWRNCEGRVLEGMGKALGENQIRRLISEYRAKQALVDLGKWSSAFRKVMNDNFQTKITSEWTPSWLTPTVWYATPYAEVTNDGTGLLTPEYRTTPGWSGANQIPLHDASQSTDIARNTLDETYAQIISDCQNAINLLPEKKSYSSTDLGRACKDAACTQLAKVYLVLAPSHTEYYQKVADLCDEVTSMGYDLSSCKYEDNFGIKANNNPESIFEIQYTGDTSYDFWGTNGQSSWLSTFMGPRNSGFVAGGYGWNQPTKEFIDSYESGDLRKDITVFYSGCPDFDGNAYDPSWSYTGYNVRKFLVSKKDSPETNTNPSNFVVYRYADILLMKAEALNEMRSTTLAETPLNIVRKRVGLVGISGKSQSDMREIIIHERRMELAFEGHRWFDLIRIGKNGEYAINYLKSIGKANINNNRLLLPIPQTEMDSNNAMVQNPGY